jgi:hypothetical protein
MTATSDRRQLKLQMVLQPCRMRTRIRGLKALAERLEKAIGLIASDDTISPEMLDFFLWKLLSAANLLRLRLEEARKQALGVPESGPRTSRSL